MFFKTKRIRDAKHLAFIRTLPCVKTGSSPCEACHIRLKGTGGMGMKPDDSMTLPMSHEAHSFQHSVGENAFYKNIYCAHDLAKFLYDNTGDRETCAREITRRRGELF